LKNPNSLINDQKLIKSFEVLRNPETKAKADDLGLKMSLENGVQKGAASFYRNLPLDSMICDVSVFNNQTSKLAHIYCINCSLKMCAEVDSIIHRNGGGRSEHKRTPYRTKVWARTYSRATLAQNAATVNAAEEKKHTMKKLQSRFTGLFQTSTAVKLEKEKRRKSLTIFPQDIHQLEQSAVAVEAAYSKAIAFLVFWQKLDSDGNESISETELIDFFSNKDDAQAILSMVDWNGDQQLSFSELAWIMSPRPNAIQGKKKTFSFSETESG
jgi:hypothetical protein